MSLGSKFKRHSANCTRGHKQGDDYNRKHWDCNCHFTVQGLFRFQLPNGEIVIKRARRTTGESQEDRADAVIQAALDRTYWVDVTTSPKKKIAKLKTILSNMGETMKQVQKQEALIKHLKEAISAKRRLQSLKRQLSKVDKALGEQRAKVKALSAKRK